MYKDIFLYLH